MGRADATHPAMLGTPYCMNGTVIHGLTRPATSHVHCSVCAAEKECEALVSASMSFRQLLYVEDVNKKANRTTACAVLSRCFWHWICLEEHLTADRTTHL